ncbi:MAG: gamma-glutamyltransferase family protein [Bryobacteraceae bacterium]
MKLKLAVLLTTVVVGAWAQAQPPGAPVKLASRGTHGAVAAGSEYATEAGMRMYYAGGNAVDAGIATMLAAAVTEFHHFGMGGESPILVRTKAGKVYEVAGVGTMPMLATADFFRNRKNVPLEIRDPPSDKGMRDWVPTAGILGALVPGMVEGALVTLREFGTKSFSEAVEPAIELADGYPMDELGAMFINADKAYFEKWPTSKRVFLQQGRPPFPGEIFRQPDLARTLRSMAEAEKKALAAGASRAKAMDAVRDFFYRGDVAHRIDAFSKADGGLLRYEDMAAFHVEPAEALSTTFQGYTVYKPGFWSQGPTMIEALNILEGFNLANMGMNSANYIHTMTEAFKLAYADRDTYYGDPKFNQIPTEKLLSKGYGLERAKLISATQASLDFRPGEGLEPNPPKHPFYDDIPRYKIDEASRAKDTTCVDAIDKDGVAISITPSGAWLPSVIAGDTGIPLTERAQQFLLVSGHPNVLEGGKRPRVTLSPTIVVNPAGTVIALSTPGGDNQEQALLEVLFYNILFHLGPEWAVEYPRFQTEHLVDSFDNHAMSPGSLLVDERIPPQVIEELKRRGHRVEIRPRTGSGAAPVIVRLDPTGALAAGADPYFFRSAHAW